MDRNKERKYIDIYLVEIIILIGIALIFSTLLAEKNKTKDIAIEFNIDTINDNHSDYNESDIIAGKSALVTFKIIDNNTLEPITGLDPEITFYMPGEHDPVNEHKHFGNYHLTDKIDMTRLQLFVVNSEQGTIEVLDTFGDYDPRPKMMKDMGTMTSELINIKERKTKVADIVVEGNYVYVTLPEERQLAAINTITHKIEKYIDIGAMPGRMFLQPNSKYLWVSNEGSGSVSIIDTKNNDLVKTIETGKGYHQVAFSEEYAFITNTHSNTVSIIKLRNFEKMQSIDVQKIPYGISFSKKTNEIFVTNTLSGTVSVIDVSTKKIIRHIPLDIGIETISFSPDGDKGIITNKYTNKSYIIDEKGNLIKKIDTGYMPDYVTFLEDYVLVHNAHSPDVTYISTIDPNLSKNMPVGTQQSSIGKPHSFITTSHGDEAVLANPIEGNLYFIHKMHGEPMAMTSTKVLMGSDMVAIVENKPQETDPGIYQQYILPNKEGTYIIDFKTEEINASYEIEIIPGQIFQTVPLFNKTIETEKNSTIQYQIIDRKGPVENITDLTYSFINPATISKGIWTKRLPSKYVGNGTYEVQVTLPENGRYLVMLSSNTLQEKGYEITYDYITVKNNTI